LLERLADLDAWDEKRVNEYDHDRRHAAYNRLLTVSPSDPVFSLAQDTSRFQLWHGDSPIPSVYVQLFIHSHCFTITRV
jgi:hypothetical protein